MFYWLELNGVEATRPAGAIETFSIFSQSFGPNVHISGTFSVYLRPNVYIYVQMSILMSNGCGFLWVIRVFTDCRTSDSLRLGPSGRESHLTGRIYPLFQ